MNMPPQRPDAAKRTMHKDGTLELSIPDPASPAPAKTQPKAKGSTLVRTPTPAAPSRFKRPWSNTQLKPCPLHKALQTGCGIRSAKTVARYNRNLAELRKICNGETCQTLLYHPDATVRLLDRAADKCGWSKHYHCGLLSALLSCIRHTVKCKSKAQPNTQACIAKLQAHHKQIQLLSQQPMIQNTATDREIAGFISFPQLCKARDSLEKGSRERLFLAMVTMIPPCRGGDMACVRVFAKEPTEKDLSQYAGNYIVISQQQPHICWRQYKSQHSYGVVKVALPGRLLQEIQASLDTTPRQWLFSMAHNSLEPYNRNAFSAWATCMLKRVTGNPYINVHLIRHAYVSHYNNLYDTSKLTDPAKIALYDQTLRQIARCMMHSLERAKQYVFKLVPETGLPEPLDNSRVHKPQRPSSSPIQLDLLP